MKNNLCIFNRKGVTKLLILAGLFTCFGAQLTAQEEVRKLTFEGTLSEHKLDINDLNPALPSDWTSYTHLVMEMRTSSPQRFSIWLYRSDGTPGRIKIQPFGQNVWLRASIPIKYFVGWDESGDDLASATNRRTNSFWYSIAGPHGGLKTIESIGIAMPYPINKPTVEIRNIHLSKQDEGSEFLEKTPVLDEFNQWAHADWPGKIRSTEQLTKELADEAKSWEDSPDFNYCAYSGYKNTSAKATGFFRVAEIDGRWWFVDPHGHLFLSSGSNGAGAGFGSRPGSQSSGSQRPPVNPTEVDPIADRTTPRLKAWGMTTGGSDMPYTVMLRFLRQMPGGNFFGLPDAYSEEFASAIDQAANAACTPLRNDPLLLGYFVGNEPAFDGRESEVVDMILAGPNSSTQNKLKEFLEEGDTPKRRKEFLITAFERYLDLACAAIKKYDPNHLTLGIRFGGNPSDELLRTGRKFDVCSINVYEYEPIANILRASRYTGRPVLIGEFHIGVPANGHGAGLVQAMDQVERGKAYRFYVEQAASVSSFLGSYWFAWRDEPVLGRRDGENYNLGLLDGNDRPYMEMVEAIRATNIRLFDVHSGNALPFNERPKASEAGTPSSPWHY